MVKPLRVTRRKPDQAAELAAEVVGDVGDRPGDLALVQFALTEAWDKRASHGDDLPRSHGAVGRVEGALARRADAITQRLVARDVAPAVIAAALLRLGSLSGGGPTRRVARRAEFSADGWEVIQTLAEGERGNRLVLISGQDGQERAEIAHEALLTQWADLNTWLMRTPDDKRALDPLADRVAGWQGVAAVPDPDKPSPFAALLRGFGLQADADPRPVLQSVELARFEHLRARHPDWLAGAEVELLHCSRRYADAAAAREGKFLKVLQVGLALAASAVVLITIALGFMGLFWWRSVEMAEANARAAFAGLAEAAMEQGRFDDAAKLALAALPRQTGEAIADRERIILRRAAAVRLYETLPVGSAVTSVAFSPDGRRLATGSEDRTVRVWRVADAAGPDVVRHRCAAPEDTDTSALAAPCGLTIAPICTHDQQRITLDPLFIAGPPILPPTPPTAP